MTALATRDKVGLFKHCGNFLCLSTLGLGLLSPHFYAPMILRRLKITQMQLYRKAKAPFLNNKSANESTKKLM